METVFFHDGTLPRLNPPGPSKTLKWPPKWTLRGRFYGAPGEKGPSRDPSWSNFLRYIPRQWIKLNLQPGYWEIRR